MYGYNISSKLVSKKQAHQAKLQECLVLALLQMVRLYPSAKQGKEFCKQCHGLCCYCVLQVGCSTGLSLVLIAFLFLKTPLALTVQCNC